MQIAEGENEGIVAPQADPPAVTPEPLQPDAGSPPDTPEPSPGTDEPEGKETLASVIAGVIAESAEGEEPKPVEPVKPEPAPPADKPAEDKPKEPEPKPGTAPDEGDDPTDDELKAMRPNARKGIVRLLSQRNAARREAAEVTQRWDADKTDAKSFRDIAHYMQSSRLDAREIDFIFDIGAKLKSTDPTVLAQAADVLVSMTTNLMERLGRTLPADLKAKVEAGEVNEEIARQAARDRATAQLAQQHAQRISSEQVAQQQQTLSQESARQIVAAVNQWEARTKASDPDWKLKAPALVEFSRGVVAKRGYWPRTPEEAVTFAQEAYASVTNLLKSARPAPSATRPSPGPSQNGNRAALKPAASSFHEHMGNVIRDLEATRAAHH